MYRAIALLLLAVEARADLLTEVRAGFPLSDARTHSLSISVGDATFSQSGFTLKDDDFTSLWCAGAGAGLCGELTDGQPDLVTFGFNEHTRSMPESDFFRAVGIHNHLQTTPKAEPFNGVDFGGYDLERLTFGFECFVMQPQFLSTYLYTVVGSPIPEPGAVLLILAGLAGAGLGRRRSANAATRRYDGESVTR